MAPRDKSIPTTEQTYSSGKTSGPPDLRLLHYNDVYHVDSSSAEPAGGAARFQTVVNEYRHDARYSGQSELLTFFSGDAFNPSLESSVTKGKHMVPVLNGIGTDVAAVGNHDFDFGVQRFRHLVGQCKFPWLLANVLDPALGEDEPLGNAKKTVLLTSSNGIKVGVIGLAEREWLDTINSLPPNIIYKSASQTAKELVPGLREQGAEIIIAVTHQREPNDNKLAEKTPDGLIDLILGGHDHFYNHSFINGTHVLRSGSDFKNLSYIEARRQGGSDSKRWDFDIVRRNITSEVKPDPKTTELVQKLTASLKAKLERPIGYTAAPLDARFRTVRLQESNIGNFVCDLMRFYYRADCCLMAAGTIRGDQIYPPGVLKLKDIMDCFPFEDPVVVIKLKGRAILEALENSVSKYPALEGRFPQVSNIEFEFHPEKPEGSRVLSTQIDDAPLDPQKDYVLATRGYMARGKDGYDSLLVKSEGGAAEEIVSEENGVLISTMLRQYFMSMKVMRKWRHWGPSMGRHWEDVKGSLHRKHGVVESKPPSPELRKVPSSDQNKDSGEPPSAKRARVERHQHDDELRPENDDSDSDSDSDADVDASADGRPTAASTMVGPTTMATSKGTTSGVRPDPHERELQVIRRVMRKWQRLAGLKGIPAAGDQLGEGEFTANWTRAIAPRLEGRIRMVETS